MLGAKRPLELYLLIAGGDGFFFGNLKPCFLTKVLTKQHLEITIPSPKLPLPANIYKGFVISFSILGCETHLFLLLKKQLYSDVPSEKKQTQMCRSLSFVRGYAKICDLGFARFVLSKTYTFLGTPDAWVRCFCLS